MNRESTAPPGEAVRWLDLVSPEERRELLRIDPLRSWAMVLGNWAIVFAAMALVAVWPNPLTVVVGLAAPFPITRESFRRKVWRDLSGQTGWKQAKAVFRRDVGLGSKPNQRTLGMNRGEQPDVGWHKLVPVATTNLALLALLALAGHAWLYLLWVAAWLTTYRLVTRIRAIAEHGMVPDNLDPLRNTRTTLARWWERLLIAPNHVNFHLEHHLMMTVPAPNLHRFHRLLRERGVLDRSPIARGYAEVLRLATAKPSAG